ncbi:MG2 domain-containing protein [Myxococcus stipitatus]|uniref:MG2 domain-containing protein n=1 Tax=Myxococcus stipitatus TaxID=83455 RepID=UPI001F38DA5F|nr:alpha-2-macroglobulin family protein [Myxococcus stipitatus]MCE9670853.1 MG2 domain-containing protein [Myxococcus stipitatus]
MTLSVSRLLGVLAVLGLSAPLMAMSRPGPAGQRPAPRMGEPRFQTYVSTDKPMYRPGEQVLARGLLLHADTRKPLTKPLPALVEIRGPKGDVILQGRIDARDAVWGHAWTIPEGQAGGEYTLRVSYPSLGAAPVERRFDVRAYRAPRLKSQIEFLRDGYGPGDLVTATLDVKRAEGGVPVGATVTGDAIVDGLRVAQVPCTVDATGHCTIRFPLPKAMERGEGTLAFTIQDGGVVETASKTLPILLQTLDLALFPEGGDLVAGLSSRVYFEARTPARKPADLKGAVVEQETGKVVAEVASEHEGRGRFELTPRAGATYALRIDSPSGIRKTFPLPRVKTTGATLRASEDIVAAGAPVRLTVGARGVGRVTVTLSQRERRLETVRLDNPAGGEVTLKARDVDGVLIATLWDADGRPLAERLVFRQPEKDISLELKADRQRYVPGAPVELTARTTRDGKPVSALVLLTVTDDAVLELQEKRDQAPSLPVMVLLEPEVKELADAQLYFDQGNPRSRRAVDLLLGTQGWRRFATVDASAFLSQHGEQALRAFAVSWRNTPRLVGNTSPSKGIGLRPAEPRRKRASAEPQLEFEEGAAVAELAAGAPVAQDQVAQAPAPAAPPVEKAARDDAAFAGGEVLDEIREAPAMLRRKRAMNWDGNQVLLSEPLAYVREYAHLARPGRKAGDRRDFAETLYWTAGVRTDPRSGEATVRFAMSDSVTTFKALGGVVGDDGALGSAVATLESVQPFYAEPKLPLEVTAGDRVQLPVALVNGTTSTLNDARVKLDVTGAVRFAGGQAMSLAAGARGRQLYSLEIGREARPVDVKLTASAGDYRDVVTRTLSIKPEGFPGNVSFGGLLSASQPAAHAVTLPDDVVPGTLRASIKVYPAPLANMTESLERLIQEPSGCFEQTSSTTYPMTMAQQYFQTHSGVSPALVSSAREKLERGYQRLVGFETKQRGYEWFGEAPGHEALTAFGLLHFTDMKRVRDVDAAMLERTRGWMLGQRDGKGGFTRKRRALHVWVEDEDTSNAYITWALLESADSRAALAKELSREVAAVRTAATRSSNSYVVALGANVLSLAGDRDGARALMTRLARLQQSNGMVGGGTQSIVGSSGVTLDVETTALAVLAWLREPEHQGSVQRAMKFLAETNDGGRYGTTQSTVLTLRAIIAYDQQRATSLVPGQVRVYVEGRPVGEPVRFDGSSQEALALPDVSALLGPGGRRVELRMEGGSQLPYSVEVTYSSRLPRSSRQTQVALEVTLAKQQLTEGEPTEARVMVLNRTDQKLPTAVAIFGVPGGLEVRHDQLKELVKRQLVDAYEVLGRDVVLYWRGMEPRKRIDVPLSLVAAVPGTYTGPASRAYLYYTDEHKVWSEGVKVSIAPRP